jgi:Lanthionine synthetase C-like protein/Protein kinase domain
VSSSVQGLPGIRTAHGRPAAATEHPETGPPPTQPPEHPQTEQPPADQPPADQPPAGHAPTDPEPADTPATDTPVVDTPVVDTPATGTQGNGPQPPDADQAPGATEGAAPRLLTYPVRQHGRPTAAVTVGRVPSAADAGPATLVDIVRASLPDPAWRMRIGPRWCDVLRPTGSGDPARIQGWTLHLSATPASAGQVVARVVPVLRKFGVGFTFASSIAVVRQLISRDCDRSLSGKVLTVHPDGDGQAVALAAELHASTEGLAGPRILSAQPFRPGSLVHYRYDAYGDTAELDDDGVLRRVLTAPDGNRVTDRRDGSYAAPDWVSSPFTPSAPTPAATTPETTEAPAVDTADESARPSSDQTRSAAPSSTEPSSAEPGAADDSQPAAEPRPSPSPVLLDQRFLVRQAVRQSPAGGVYLVHDRETDTDVVVKHARAHADARSDGTDARDRLRHEAAMLHLLGGEAPVPRLVKVFEQFGDLFLAEELLPGRALGSWVRALAGQTSAVPADQVLVTARQLVAVVAGVHAAGVVLRDLGPSSVLVAPNGALWLVDLATATTGGELAPARGTPGYQAPECRGQDQPVAARFTEDLWSLGALMFLLVTGHDPVLPDDDPADRTLRDRFASWLTTVSADNPVAEMLAPPILGLLTSEPDRRWSLTRVEKYLAVLTERASQGLSHVDPDRRRGGRPTASGTPVLPAPTADRLLADGLDHLLVTMRSESGEPPPLDGGEDGKNGGVTADGGGAGIPESLWPTSPFGARTDPGNVQHGTAGVLGLLLQALGPATDADRHRLLTAVRTAATWLSRHRPTREPDHPLPGLYFGRAGTAWALADAADALQDADLFDAAVQILESLPTSWPQAGVAQGLAGAGLAHLRVARLTDEGRLLDRVETYADAVVAAAQDSRHGLLWPVPADSRSRLAGTAHYGFAHGVAGIGAFLLAAGRACEREAYVKVALEAGHTLCRVATTDAAGAAWWPVGPDDPTRLPHWCTGASGIGSFLLRLYAATDEPALGAYAGAAAVAVHRSRWRSLPSACHGLAGDGQYLLDAAQVLGDETYDDWAESLVEAIAVRHCRRGGRLLVPGEDGQSVVSDYQTGLAGVLSFLLRLRHGGPRPWMVDDLIA